jgi:hypothetical protein
MAHTVQDPTGGVEAVDTSNLFVTDAGAFARLLQFRIAASMERAPSYGTTGRDEWMVDFVHSPGNDMLAGAISTVTAMVVANSWYVEGPLLQAAFARDQLLHQSNFNDGWDKYIAPLVEGYLNRDGGGTGENLRTSAADHEGPAMGYAHIDESKMKRTGNHEYPFKYWTTRTTSGGVQSGFIRMHRSQVLNIVDMPSGKDALKGIGFCAVSRCITIALTLQQVAKYTRERLSDLPPAGLLLINNLGEEEWGDLVAKYDARQFNEGNTVWRDVMTAFGIDPAYPLQAEWIKFAEPPEHFDLRDFLETTIYSFALAFREDPRKFWPVSSGPLGTATEAELQARSARLKGEGIIANAIERQLNRPDCLPDEVHFHFDYQDDEADMLAAELNDTKSQTIRRFWEASPNAGFAGGGSEEPEAGPEPEPERQVGEIPQAASINQGIITTEEARDWAIRERIIPWDVLSQPVDVERIYDTRAWKHWEDMGPIVRFYKDGRCAIVAPNRRVWNGFSPL